LCLLLCLCTGLNLFRLYPRLLLLDILYAQNRVDLWLG
jgi:hypothetical protein